MEHEFWHARWSEGRIGFHQAEGNEMLRRHRDRLPGQGARVLVPLCGKARDLWLLAEAGAEVVGIELSSLAAEAFFAEAGVEPARSQHGPFAVLAGRGVSIWVGDFFEATPERVGAIDAIYDRAALVALPPETRPRYAARLLELLPAGRPLLLVTLVYDPSLVPGPPFSVGPDEVKALFAGAASIEPLSDRLDEAASPKFKEQGASLTEAAWLVVR